MSDWMGTGMSMRRVAERAFKAEVKKRAREEAARARKKELRRAISSGEDDEDSLDWLKGCGCLIVAGIALPIMASSPFAAFGLPAAVIAGWIGIRKWRDRRREGKVLMSAGISAGAEAGVSRFVRAFEDGDPDAVQMVCRFAMRDFQRQIRNHRRRTLGPKSEWGVARASLEKAADGAQRSRAYWQTRLAQEPGNPLAERSLDTAKKLDAKLGAARSKLDRRADVLKRFYNDCEAKLAAMGRYNRDIEETRRLAELSDTADTLIVDAQETLAAIGASFVVETQRVGTVIEDFQSLQFKSLAGEVAVDDIEFLADQIIDASDEEYDVVRQLDATVRQMEALDIR